MCFLPSKPSVRTRDNYQVAVYPKISPSITQMAILACLVSNPKSPVEIGFWNCDVAMLSSAHRIDFLYSVPRYLMQSSYQFWKSIETFKTIEKSTENIYTIHFSTLGFGKITTNTQTKHRELFLSVTAHLKGFQVIFIFIIFPVCSQLLANLHFNNMGIINLTSFALSKAALCRYTWRHSG